MPALARLGRKAWLKASSLTRMWGEPRVRRSVRQAGARPPRRPRGQRGVRSARRRPGGRAHRRRQPLFALAAPNARRSAPRSAALRRLRRERAALPAGPIPVALVGVTWTDPPGVISKKRTATCAAAARSFQRWISLAARRRRRLSRTSPGTVSVRASSSSAHGRWRSASSMRFSTARSRRACSFNPSGVRCVCMGSYCSLCHGVGGSYCCPPAPKCVVVDRPYKLCASLRARDAKLTQSGSKM